MSESAPYAECLRSACCCISLVALQHRVSTIQDTVWYIIDTRGCVLRYPRYTATTSRAKRTLRALLRLRYHARSCEALEERLEAMRTERRRAGGGPPDLLARHAAEVEGLALQLATLKASCDI